MADLVDLTHLEESEQAVLRQLKTHGCAWVLGRPGSGRSTLASRLRKSLSQANFVELPTMGPDAAIHGLIQAAAATRDPATQRESTDDKIPFVERVSRVARKLADLDETLVLLVPRTWPVTKQALRPEYAHEHIKRARRLIEGLLLDSKLRSVGIFSQASDLFSETGRDFGPVELPPAPVKLAGLLDAQAWGTYAEPAEKVHRLSKDFGPVISPIALRMAVGLLALDEKEEDLQPLLSQYGSFIKIGERLISKLSEEGHRGLLLSLRRCARSRFPQVRADAERIAGLPKDHLPLLTECVGYGAEHTRINDWLRVKLDSMDESDPETHLSLANLYKSRDGVNSAGALSPESAIPWLERVHHLASAGAEGESEWSALDGLTMEQLWDRARSLSITYGQKEKAAEIYRKCTVLDPSSSYSWHYLAYNLERAGGDSREITQAYQKAIELDIPNPWWNGRFVRFLVHSLRPEKAKREWSEVKRRVYKQSPPRWVAKNMHLPLIHAWLSHGFVSEAKDVLNEVPEGTIQEVPELVVVQQQVLDAEESERLGESVYPPEMPMEARWKQPDDLVDLFGENGKLDTWHPARVVGREQGGIRVVFATTSEQKSDDRRILTSLIPLDDWELATGQPLDESLDNPFALIGVFSDGSMRIKPACRGFAADGVFIEPAEDAAYDEVWRSAKTVSKQEE